MKRKMIISIVSMLLIGLTIHLAYDLNENGNENQVDFGTQYIVKRRDIGSSVLATGIIKPKIGAEVKVGAQVSGIVKKLFVEIGDRVNRGDLLAQIEETPYKAEVDQAKAVLELEQTNKKYAETEMIRVEKLKEKGYASDQDLELLTKQYEIAIAKIKQAEADLSYANLQMDYTRITAPISGVVASVSTQEGETVAASFTSPTFVTIIDLNRLEVWAYVDETDIGRVELGKPVKFTVDTYPNEEIGGVVEAIYPKAEIQNNVVNYITVVSISEVCDKILRPEMTTTVNIEIEQKTNVLAVPKKYVKSEDGYRYVLSINGNEVNKRNVQLGVKDKKYYEILSGIEEGNKLVLNTNINE